MAKVTITFEDLPGGIVSITGEPSLSVMLGKAKTPGSMTSAEGYAMICWTAVRDAANTMGNERVFRGDMH